MEASYELKLPRSNVTKDNEYLLCNVWDKAALKTTELTAALTNIRATAIKSEPAPVIAINGFGSSPLRTIQDRKTAKMA